MTNELNQSGLKQQIVTASSDNISHNNRSNHVITWSSSASSSSQHLNLCNTMVHHQNRTITFKSCYYIRTSSVVHIKVQLLGNAWT
eukprot:6465301-Amphidinium_carterae.1